MTLEGPVRKTRWLNLIFFIVTGVTGVIGTPLYLYFHGFRLFDFLFFLFFVLASGLSITMGYHRLFAHVTYKAHRVVEFLYLFFGAAAFEQSAFKWASQHRDHHLYTDTERDPYSSKKGLWYSHIGWLISWVHPEHYENVHDLRMNKMIIHQHKHFVLWAVTAGILTPVMIGALVHSAGAAFIMAVCLRIALVHHTTFCINSFCHYAGKKTYDLKSSGRDHWFIALFTFGEGYHNFHHRFPSDYRNGIRWYHWDPSKWLIACLTFVGLARKAQRTPNLNILHARLVTERQVAHARLSEKIKESAHVTPIKVMIEIKYAQLQKAMRKVQLASEHYRSVLLQMKVVKSNEAKALKEKAFAGLRVSQARLKKRYQNWVYFVRNFDTPLLRMAKA